MSWLTDYITNIKTFCIGWTWTLPTFSKPVEPDKIPPEDLESEEEKKEQRK